jgi:uncharacterized small protein (DUF1192 family)
LTIIIGYIADIMDIKKWLNDLGLGIYVEAFEENAIDSESLFYLTDDDLKELSVLKLGHRKKILKAISAEIETERDKKKSSKSVETLTSDVKINECQVETASSCDVFISYSTEDDIVARTIVSAFESQRDKVLVCT